MISGARYVSNSPAIRIVLGRTLATGIAAGYNRQSDGAWINALAISSTNIRKRVARGMSVRYLTSESVLGYIRKRRLYADLGQEDFE